jgi:short-subunit dehydrogenase
MRFKLKPLKKQVLIITGASSGVGLAVARKAVAAGAAVVLVARNEAVLHSIADELRRAGGRVAVCAADVADRDAPDRILRVAEQAFGGFDTWINDAAVTSYGTLEEIGMDEQHRVFDVNYFGMLQGCLTAVRHLRARGGGAIINLGSVLSDRTLIKPSGMHTPFPEHGRNHMDAPPRTPQIVYDPDLAADAVLFAAQHPRRQIYVGGYGFMLSVLARLFPRTTDRIMEVLMVRTQQSPQDPGDATARDNLFEPKKDGSVLGSQDVHVKRWSSFLEAQKHPLAALALVAGATGLGIGLAVRRAAVQR